VHGFVIRRVVLGLSTVATEEFHLKEPIVERYWLWVKQLPTEGFGTTVLAVLRGRHPREHGDLLNAFLDPRVCAG
jgi:hypothetical protein